MFCSTVRTSSFGPPKAKAALILVLPRPGMSTSESRGMESSMLGPSPVCSSMIVSVRWPTSPPVPSRLRSSLESPLRLSEPTRRYVVPGCSSGRAPLGSMSTLSIWLHAHRGTAIRKTSQATRSSRMILPIGRLRRVFFGLPGEGTGWFGCTGRLGGGVSPPLDAAGRSTFGSIRVGSGSSDPDDDPDEGGCWPDFWPPYSQP